MCAVKVTSRHVTSRCLTGSGEAADTTWGKDIIPVLHQALLQPVTAQTNCQCGLQNGGWCVYIVPRFRTGRVSRP